MADSEHQVSSELPPGVGEAAVAESTAAESAETQSVPDAALSATPLATLPTAEAETASAATGAASAAPDTEPAGAAEPAGGGEAAVAGGMNPPTTTTPETSGGGPRKPILAGAAIAGAVLVAVPLLLVAGKSEPPAGGSAVAAEAAATLLEDGAQGQKPGEFVPAPPAPTKGTATPRATSGAAAPTSGEESSPTRREAASPTRREVQNRRPVSRAAAPKKRVSAPKALGTGRDATFRAGSKLCVNEAWTSYDGRTVLRMQADRNLVLYRDGGAVWAAPERSDGGTARSCSRMGTSYSSTRISGRSGRPGSGGGPLI